MASMHICGKTLLNRLLQKQKADNLGTWFVTLGLLGPSRVCINDESGLTLTFLRQGQKRSRSNWILNAIILEHS